MNKRELKRKIAELKREKEVRQKLGIGLGSEQGPTISLMDSTDYNDSLPVFDRSISEIWGESVGNEMKRENQKRYSRAKEINERKLPKHIKDWDIHSL